MFPILLNLSNLKVLLVGNGNATLRRLHLLDSDKAKHVKVFSAEPTTELRSAAGNRLVNKLPEVTDYNDADVVMVADFSIDVSANIAKQVRELGKLVNVEDVTELCDYHVPAIVRRGDLLLTVSTNSASPRLARRLRQLLEKMFGEGWAERVNEIRKKRQEWKKAGVSMQEVAAKTDEIIDKNEWFKDIWNAKPTA